MQLKCNKYNISQESTLFSDVLIALPLGFPRLALHSWRRTADQEDALCDFFQGWDWGSCSHSFHGLFFWPFLKVIATPISLPSFLPICVQGSCGQPWGYGIWEYISLFKNTNMLFVSVQVIYLVSGLLEVYFNGELPDIKNYGFWTEIVHVEFWKILLVRDLKFLIYF